MIRFIRLVEVGKAGIACPLEVAAINNYATNRSAMPTDKFCRGMNDNICAPLKRPAQVWRCEGIVNDQRNAELLPNLCHFFKREHIDERITKCFSIQDFCIGLDRSTEVLRICWVDKCYL